MLFLQLAIRTVDFFWEGGDTLCHPLAMISDLERVDDLSVIPHPEPVVETFLRRWLVRVRQRVVEINVLADEANRSVSEQELRATDMITVECAVRRRGCRRAVAQVDLPVRDPQVLTQADITVPGVVSSANPNPREVRPVSFAHHERVA